MFTLQALEIDPRNVKALYRMGKVILKFMQKALSYVLC